MGARTVTADEVRRYARAEHAAEQSREQAEAAWRAAWWETTLALAAVEGGAGKVRAATEAAAAELGQSPDFVQKRRELGRRVDHVDLKVDMIHTLPPRLTRVWTESGGGRIDRAAAAELLQAEADGVSIRDLAAQFAAGRGEAINPQWQRADERKAAEQDPERIADIVSNAPAEAIRRAVAEREDVQRAVAEDREVYDRVREAASDGARGRLREGGVWSPDQHEQHEKRQDREAGSTGALLRVRAELLRAAEAIRTATQAVADAVVDDEDRAALTSDVAGLRSRIDTFERAIAGDIDDALRKLIEAEA